MIDENHIEAFESYLQGKDKSPSTIASYISAIKQFYDIITNKTPERITESDIERYTKKMCAEYKMENNKNSNTLSVKYSGIRKYLRFLKIKKINDVVKELDVETLRPPKWIDKLIEPLTHEELKQLLEASKRLPRDYVLVYLLIETAGRISEVISIKINNINGKEKTVKIYDKKTRQWTIRNIPKGCLEAIKTYIKIYREIPSKGNENVLFLNYKGEQLTYPSAYRSIKRVALYSGLKKRIYPHIIRHSVITLMAKSDMTLQQIKTHTGHKSSKALDKYQHLTHKDIKDKLIKSISMDDEEETTSRKQLDPSRQPHPPTPNEITPENFKETKEYKEFLNWKKQQEMMYQ